MKIRIYTNNTYLDEEIKDIDIQALLETMDACDSIAIDKQDGNTLVINTTNIIAIEIVRNKNKKNSEVEYRK